MEGSGFHFHDGGAHGPPHAVVPAPPPGQAAAPAPQLHLPYANGILYVYWSVDGFPELVNGWGGFVPASDAEFNHDAFGFPDARSVALLRARGVRTVILHPELAPNTPWAGAAEKSVAGLPLRREVRGGVVLFHLKPI